MKILRYIALALLMTVIMPQAVSAKGAVVPKGYLFGFVANFTDSVVYFTDIQEVDSIWYDSKWRFLLGRDVYANQLRTHFSENLQMPHRTCIVSFGLTRKDAEKKLMKFRKAYTGKKAGSYEVRNLNENQFRFTTVNMAESVETPMTKAERKAAKAEMKQKQKAAKQKQKEARQQAKEAQKARKQAKQAEKEAKKLAGAKKSKKDTPDRRPIDPTLPPAEVEMHQPKAL